MNASSLRRVSPQVIFGMLLAAFVAIEVGVVQSAAFGRGSGLLSVAVCIDCVLVPVLLGWGLLVRSGRAKPGTLLGVAGGGMFLASLLLPHPPSFLAALRWMPALAEVGLLVWGVIVGRSFWAELRRKNAASDDVLVNVQSALAATPGLPVILQAMAAEVLVLWYGLCAFRKKAPSGPGVFAYHESLLALVVLVIVATPAEGVLFHYLLSLWSKTAAWIGTALHFYTLIWVVSFYQAARLRPVVIENEALQIRWSLLWNATVLRAEIQAVEVLKERPAKLGRGCLDLARFGDKLVRVTFSGPVSFHGPLGIRRDVRCILLSVERPEAFLAQLEAKVG
jgi:hypothetical protein